MPPDTREPLKALNLLDTLLRIIRNSNKTTESADGWHCSVTGVQQRLLSGQAKRSSKRLTRPEGQPGGSGYDTGWMRRPCRTQDPRSIAFSAKPGSARAMTTRQIKSCRSISSRYERCRCNCRRRRTGEPSRSDDSRHSNRDCWRRSRCRRRRRRAGPRRGPSRDGSRGLRQAWWWSELPVTARAATARAAILVLIDMMRSPSG